MIMKNESQQRSWGRRKNVRDDSASAEAGGLYRAEKSYGQFKKYLLRRPSCESEPLDHVLFYGPPGLGKTTLAGIISMKWASISGSRRDRLLSGQVILLRS